MKISFSNSFVKLKPAKQSDINYCYKLSKRNMSEYKLYKRTYRQYKDEFVISDVKVIWYKERRFGFIEFQVKKDGWYLWDMQLSKILRNKGLGSKLMTYLIDEAKRKRGKVLKLFVYKNNPAVGLYERFGFKAVKKNSTSTRLQMEKLLT